MGQAAECIDPPVAVIATTPTGVVTLWSPRAESLFEVPEREAVGARVFELVDWHADTSYIDEYARLNLDEVWVYRNLVTTRNGNGFVLKTTASLALDDRGSEEFLLAASNAGPGVRPDAQRGHLVRPLGNRFELTLFCHEDSTIEYAGSALFHLLGYVPRQVIGHRISQYVDQRDMDLWRSRWLWALSNPGEPSVLTARVRRADGGVRWAEFTLTNLLGDASVSAVVASVRDVSEYHRAADVLAVTEQTLRSVLGSSVEGVWIFDPEGGTVFANARMAELLDVRYADLVGGPAEESVDRSVLRRIRSHIGERPPGSREEYEFPFTRRDGRTRWLRLAVVPSYDHEGAYSASIVLCADVSDLRYQVPDLPLSKSRTRWPSDAGFGSGPGRAPRGSGRPGRRTPDVDLLERLSPREHEVVVRLLRGDRVPAIASTLFVSQSTIRNQLSSVFRKLGVGSQQELIALLRESGG